VGRRWTPEEEQAALASGSYEEFAAIFPQVSRDAWRIRRGLLSRVRPLAFVVENPTCKLCSFLKGLSPSEALIWRTDLANSKVSHQAVVDALRAGGNALDEASVRRHRRNHGN
jgi:hypothetical protein